MMPVACGCCLLCRLDVFCRLEVRVVLKLALCFKSSLLEVLKLCFKSSLPYMLKLIMPSVPHCHKALLQPGGNLYLFLISSKKYWGWRKPSFLQLAHRVVFLALGWPPFFRREISRSKFLMSLLWFFTRATRLLLLVPSVVLFNTSCLRTPCLFTAAAARLSKYPSRFFRLTLSYLIWLLRGRWADSWQAAELVAPNLSLPSLASDFTLALAWACL